MQRKAERKCRGGAIVPLVAVALVGVLGMVALAIDLTLVMIARNQAQAAADAAALAGARTLNSDTAHSNNSSGAKTNAQNVAQTNSILGQPITAGQVATVNIGDYWYDYTNNKFQITTNGLGLSGDNYNLCQVTVNFNTGQSFFSAVFGMNGFNTGATATAAHRPRDVVIVQDFSSSMRLDSMMGMPKNASITQSMLPLSGNDGAGNAQYPLFGQYSNKALAQFSASDYPPTGPPSGYYVNDTGELCSPGNLVTDTSDGPAIVNYFFADTTALGSSTPAFAAAPTSFATTPGGDPWMSSSKNTSGTYATTVNDIVGSSTTWDLLWELDGYAAYSGGSPNPALNNQTDYSKAPYSGYTQGPLHFGKSFMNWPPDPRSGPLTNVTGTTAPSVQWFVTKILGVSSPSNLTNIQKGIFQVVGGVPASNSWSSWTATTLSAYLQLVVGLTPGATNQQYERIMRLFNRGYPAGPSGGTFSADWRARFFCNPDGVTPLNDNDSLWDSNGNWLPPRDSSGNDNYRINYTAILAWISASASNPTTIFPNQVRSGGVKYYTQIPTSIDVTTFPPSDKNQRFWKEFIDEVLGLQQTALNGTNQPVYQSIINGSNCQAGIGADFTLGTVQISATPTSGSPVPYVVYGDNPLRWRTKGWFGPMNFVHFLQNWNMNRWWWSGTCTEAPTFQCKLGVQAAINDIQNNHPNDNIGLVFFSTPNYGGGGGQFNTARVPLGRSYKLLTNSEWFHPWTISNPNSEFTPYDSQTSDGNMPRTQGGGTCYSMGLMLAHNQLSSNTTLRTATKPTTTQGIAGGLGRIGAAKLIIFESDGACKDKGSASLNTGGGASNSYWNVVVNDSTNPGGGGNYPGGSGTDFGAAGTVSGTPGSWSVSGASARRAMHSTWLPRCAT